MNFPNHSYPCRHTAPLSFTHHENKLSSFRVARWLQRGNLRSLSWRTTSLIRYSKGSISDSVLSALCTISTGSQAEGAFVQNRYRIAKNGLKTIENKKVWLPGMDSNHDSRLQRPLSYR
jgi:hypothetical protein